MSKTFYNVKKAKKIAEQLNADNDDDWTYKVVTNDVNNLAFIRVYDEDGFFVEDL